MGGNIIWKGRNFLRVLMDFAGEKTPKMHSFYLLMDCISKLWLVPKFSEDTCHLPPQVSLHKQDIEDRLNAWIVFNEKNKELCTWLVQMEEKVPQSADISIEDMIEKLQKVSKLWLDFFSSSFELVLSMYTEVYSCLGMLAIMEFQERSVSINLKLLDLIFCFSHNCKINKSLVFCGDYFLNYLNWQLTFSKKKSSQKLTKCIIWESQILSVHLKSCDT